MSNINVDIVMRSIDSIYPYDGSHKSDAAIDILAESLNKFGFQGPISIDKNGVIVTGNAVYKAALKVGIKEVPCIVLDYLSDDEIAQYRIADNKTGQFARWNEDKLKKEVSYLSDPNELQFCFDDDLMNMVKQDIPSQMQMFNRQSVEPSSPSSGDSLSVRGHISPVNPYESNSAPSYESQPRHPLSEEESAERAEAFREKLAAISENSQFAASTFKEFICSNCGRTIRVKI